VHTVVETPAYLLAAAKAGMTESEQEKAVLIVSANPLAGDMIAGGGGVRKIRVPKEGKGKSGGYRVLTYYLDENEPVFLISVLNKSKQGNFSDAQTKQVRQAAKEIRDER
jgi:hypothetical protein